MNKFVKLPLFLGSVCLVFCSTLAIVVNICQPIIEQNAIKKQKEAYKVLYTDVNVDGITDIVDTDLSNYSQIETIALVPHSSVESYVYTMTTKKPQSEPLRFMLGIDKTSGAIDAYYILVNNDWSFYYNNNSTVLDDLKDDNKVTSPSGQTKTQRVVQECVDQALEHYSVNYGGK